MIIIIEIVFLSGERKDDHAVSLLSDLYLNDYISVDMLPSFL